MIYIYILSEVLCLYFIKLQSLVWWTIIIQSCIFFYLLFDFHAFTVEDQWKISRGYWQFYLIDFFGPINHWYHPVCSPYRVLQKWCLNLGNTQDNSRMKCAHQVAQPSQPFTNWRKPASGHHWSLRWRPPRSEPRSWEWSRARNNRLCYSGNSPQNKVPAEVSSSGPSSEVKVLAI